MKRLTAIQKRHGVFSILAKSDYSMTGEAIGKALGFQNGVPVVHTLCEMFERGEAVYTKDQLNTGTDIFLWRLTVKGRNAAWKEFQIPFVQPSPGKGKK